MFEIQLRGKQPLILVLARGMKTRWVSEIEKVVKKNKLLVISPFEQQIKRVTGETAELRNKKIIEIIETIKIGYKSKGGTIE